jgi:hypothetical protein
MPGVKAISPTQAQVTKGPFEARFETRAKFSTFPGDHSRNRRYQDEGAAEIEAMKNILTAHVEAITPIAVSGGRGHRCRNYPRPLPGGGNGQRRRNRHRHTHCPQHRRDRSQQLLHVCGGQPANVADAKAFHLSQFSRIDDHPLLR